MLLGVREDESSSYRPGARAEVKFSRIIAIAWTSALILGMISCASAEDDGLNISQEHLDKWGCPACKGEQNYDLDIFNFLGHDWEDETESVKPPGPQEARAAMENEAESDEGEFVHPELLASVEEAEGADVVLDVGSDYETIHIKGAIPLYWDQLLDENNNPRSAAEMAEIFGSAGISPDDSVVVYGSCEPCDDISVAPFVFWALRYLGHDDVMVLDGGLEGWVAAGKATEKKANQRPAVTYEPRVRSGIWADYEAVSGGELQLVDARTLQEFAADKIARAIHIDYDEVLSGGRVKKGDDLTRVFAGLDADGPVVVYSNAGARAAMVWYALQLMGYESSIYTWNDWEANRPAVKAVLKDVWADPNPARPGPVKIYATFDVVPDEGDPETELFATETVAEEASSEDEVAEDSAAVAEEAEEVARDDNGSNETGESSNGSIVSGAEIEAILSEPSMEEPTVKTMGCVACFDPMIYASSSKSTDITGGVKLGSMASDALAPITAAGAQIQDMAGQEMATIELAPTLSDERVGTWDATGVPDGVYVVTVAAAAGGKISYFEDVLTIEIDSTAPVLETSTTSGADGRFFAIGYSKKT